MGKSTDVMCPGHEYFGRAHPSRSATDLKSKFSFSLTGYHTKVKEPSLNNNFTLIWKAKNWIHFSPKVKFEQLRSGLELESPNSFPTTITVTARASLLLLIFCYLFISVLNQTADFNNALFNKDIVFNSFFLFFFFLVEEALHFWIILKVS